MNTDAPLVRPTGLNINRIIRIVSIIIPLALAGNIIYMFLASDFSIIGGIGNYAILYLSLAFILVFMPWITHSLRISLWGRAFGKNLTFGESFRTAVAADLGAAIVPSTIGGSYAKLAILTSFGFSPGEATLVTLLGTVEDALFFAFALPFSFTMTGAWNDPGIRQLARNLGSHWPFLAGLIAFLIIAYFILARVRSRKLTRRLDRPIETPAGLIHKLWAKLRIYKRQFSDAWKFVRQNHKSTFFACIALAGIGWTCRYSIITLLVLGLGYRADPVLFFLLQWVVFTFMTLFPTPGAIGGAEVSLALVFKGIVPSGIIPILTGVWRFLTFYLIMIVGAIIIMLFGVGRSKQKPEQIKRGLRAEVEAL